MRLLSSCVGISTILLSVNFTSLAASPHPKNMPLGARTIHGLSNAKYFKAQSNGEFYIQAGSFKSEKNAENYKVELTKKYNHPINIKKQGSYYIVLIGPIHSAAAVRALDNSRGKVAHVNPAAHHDKHQFINDVRGAAILPVEGTNHFRVMGALGIANLRGGGASYLVVTSNENDRLLRRNRNGWGSFAGQLGLGYVYYLHGAQQYSENTQWFPWIEPELNGYYLGQGSIKGDVWRFSNPNFNDMTYSMPVESYRLMFDTALTLLSKKQYSLYAKGGIGNAWNRVRYNDADNNDVACLVHSLNLNSKSRASFAWEVGAGLSYALHNRFTLSLEYLYADLGRAKTPTNGVAGTITPLRIFPTDFKLAAQTALLGLHVAI